MSGVKSMLKAAANDMKQTEKIQTKSNTIKNSDKKPVDKKVEPPSEKKTSRGRPKNEEKGIKNRKQYTLTLKEETYQLIMEKAKKEELSFAKFMEKTALEYIQNNNDN